jgi:hypothetical protein
MKRCLLLFLFLQFLPSSLCAYQWPLENSLVEAGFGQEENGQFLTGALISGTASVVYPVENGRLVFYNDQSRPVSGLPSCAGSFLVVEHERGIRSFYGNLAAVSTASGFVFTDKKIGILGTNPGGDTRPLFLQVLDFQFYRYVNPLLSLPLPVDSRAPAIRQVILMKGETELRLQRDMGVDSGLWTVFVETADPYGDGAGIDPRTEKRAPHRFGVYLNGEAQGQISLESIEVTGQDLLLKRTGGLTARELYEKEGYYRIAEVRLSPGASTLEIAVSDFAGNETSRSFLLRVR